MPKATIYEQCRFAFPVGQIWFAENVGGMLLNSAKALKR
jgi:hypothetical protein